MMLRTLKLGQNREDQADQTVAQCIPERGFFFNAGKAFTRGAQLMSHNLQCRVLRDDETEAVSRLACDVFEEFVAPSYSLEGRTEFRSYATPEALRERNRVDHLTLVAEAAGRLVGMLHLKQGRHVALLFVRGGQQRCGVGRALVQAAITHSRSTRQPSEELSVNSSPNAVSAYERMGFVAVGPEQAFKGIRFIPMRFGP
jgi:GNAT superfamily N-acetyltransferase